MKLLKYSFIFILHFVFVAGAYSEEVEKLVIIGSGAAGSSAAIFAGQASLNPLVIQETDCTTQIALIHKIDNYPGILHDVDGIDLINNFRKQAENFGARFVADAVVAADLQNKPFKIVLGSGKTVYSEAIIIAAGVTKKWLGLPSEKLLRNKGVVSATFCKDTDYTGKNVVVVGGGHAALQEALFVSDKAARVTIVNHGEKFNASKFHQDEVFKTENIEVIYNASVEDILDVSQEKVTAVVLHDHKTNETYQKSTDIVIVAIGAKPNTDMFKGQLQLSAAGNIVMNCKNSSTNIPGVFAAGDITDIAYGRVAVASGAGAMAALDAIRYLEKLNSNSR